MYVRAPTIGTTVYMRQRLRVVVQLLNTGNYFCGCRDVCVVKIDDFPGDFNGDVS